MKKIIAGLITLLAMFGCSRAPRPQPVEKTTESPGKGLRTMILTTKPETVGMVSDSEFPKIYGVVCDWNIGDTVASIVSMKDGMASLYTTSTFGVIGGEGHERVRSAARRLVAEAGRFHDSSQVVTEFHYPSRGKVNYYLLTYQGVRLLTGDEKTIENGKDPSASLFTAVQDVMTELRLITEEKMKTAN
jgi:hypothetical protein